MNKCHVSRILHNLALEFFEDCVKKQYARNYCSTQYMPGRYSMRVGTLVMATIYLQLIQNRYMFRSFTVLQCSHQHCVQPVASDVEVVGYL